MANRDRIRITGAKELDRALRDLPGTMGTNVLRSAVREGANVIRDDARQRVPVDSGVLKKSITVKNRRGKRGQARVSVTLKPKGFYGMFVEHGTVHTPARPFLRPALDVNVNKVITTIGAALGRRITLAAKKVTSGQVSARTGRKIK